MAVLGHEDLESSDVLALFRVEVDLSHEGHCLELEEDVDGRHSEVSRLPAYDATGRFMKYLGQALREIGSRHQLVKNLRHFDRVL